MLKTIVLAESCNPNWPSLPVVGYKYARALAEKSEVTLVTHIRNKKDILAHDTPFARMIFIDSEWIAKPMYRLSKILRGGTDVAWSTNHIMAYLPFMAFEWQAYRKLKAEGLLDKTDLIHRITPMSPTMPSILSAKAGKPSVIGPLNGNLDWPAAFSAEQKREREGLRKLRPLYKILPYTRSSLRRADCVLAAFEHTIADLDFVPRDRIVSFPEVGFDPEIFHDRGRTPPFSSDTPKTFLFAGRLVPYKLPEVAVRSFVESPALAKHRLKIVGEGPEMPRLRAIVDAAGAADRVTFLGQLNQTEVADQMRACDAFVFPSIRELGAGVVVEAMACGMAVLGVDYGAPGDLLAKDRGITLPIGPLDTLVDRFRSAMETSVSDPQASRDIAARGCAFVNESLTWAAKADFTQTVYDTVLSNGDLSRLNDYDRA